MEGGAAFMYIGLPDRKGNGCDRAVSFPADDGAYVTRATGG